MASAAVTPVIGGEPPAGPGPRPRAPAGRGGAPPWYALGAMVAAWYALSVAANGSSHALMSSGRLPALALTAAQLGASALVAAAAARCLRPRGGGGRMLRPPRGSPALWVSGAAFAVGFLLVNAAYVASDVAIAEVIRAGEPLSTAVLGVLALGAAPSRRAWAALVLTAAGIALMASHHAAFSWHGLALGAAANVCFSARSVATKALGGDSGSRGGGAVASRGGGGDATAPPPRPPSLDADLGVFLNVCARGLCVLAALGLVAAAAALARGDGDGALPGAPASWSSLAMPASWGSLALLNAVSFFGYNQLSFCVLHRVSLLGHAMANALRRAVTAVAYAAATGAPLTGMGLLGTLIVRCPRARQGTRCACVDTRPPPPPAQAVSGAVMYAWSTPAPAPPADEEV